MDKIIIEKSNMGDTRTADTMPTLVEFAKANDKHRANVVVLMSNFARDIQKRGHEHDWTKADEPYRSQFYQAMVLTMEAGRDFDESVWMRNHYSIERHHLNWRVPEDVNLIDVIEMICDSVEAAAARSGELRYGIDLPDEVLQNAVKNTVQMVWDSVVLRGWEDKKDDCDDILSERLWLAENDEEG